MLCFSAYPNIILHLEIMNADYYSLFTPESNYLLEAKNIVSQEWGITVVS